MKYKLISTDLDGTLLNKNEAIGEINTKAMAELRNKGAIIAVNSGRTLFEMPDEVRSCKHIDYYICSNGAAIYDRYKNLIFSSYISEDSFSKVFELLRSYDTAFAVHDNGKSIISTEQMEVKFWTEHRASEYAARNFIKFSEFEKEFVKRYSLPCRAEMICCYFKYEDERLECLEKLSHITDLSTAASSGENIEIFSSRVTKGKTLKALMDRLSVSRTSVMAIGDSQNDITMLEAAALPLAVQNAKDSVKDKASEIICSCDENIMKYILDRFYI